jgi:glycosyltransferase involved in cell wall biosynthesis
VALSPRYSSGVTTTVMQVLHQGGGAGSVTSTLHLSLGLAQAGFAIRFVCPPHSEVERLARAGGLEVHPLSLEPRRAWSNADKLAELLKDQPVDLINSQSARDRQALTLLALTGRVRIPFVATRRQMPQTLLVANWVTSKVAARMVAVSHAVGEALVRRGTPRRKLVVIPNGVITERIDVPVSEEALAWWRERIGWEPSRRTIGILARPKDQTVVLRALERVATPVRLVLAGVDPASEIGRKARSVPNRHAVLCVPFTPEVRPLYDLLELVLLPSGSEGLSQALLEAMALGKPVIASAATGNLDVITDGADGRLVPAQDPAEWARAIELLLAKPSEASRMGESARITAREKFSLTRTIQRTAALYRGILDH